MDLEDILKNVPIGDIAKKFGVSEDVARQAVSEGGAALLGGMAQNAKSESGSAAIEKALSKHGGFTGAATVSEIDEADGEKIVAHVFGDNKQNVAAALTGGDKTAGIDFGKLLPIIAPIIMGLLAGQKQGSASQGGIGDLIGGLLGGGNSKGGASSGGLGDILGGLGGLLGGGQQSGDGGGLGGLLGGLLGGKK